MRRVNIQAAFVGEPTYARDSGATDQGEEAVNLVVRGGEITMVVPHSTPDEHLLDAGTILRGSLHLENERVLSFEIQDGAVGAFFEHEAASLHYRRQTNSGVGMFATSSPRTGRPTPRCSPVT